jgi:hypothetical protein
MLMSDERGCGAPVAECGEPLVDLDDRRADAKPSVCVAAARHTAEGELNRRMLACALADLDRDRDSLQLEQER